MTSILFITLITNAVLFTFIFWIITFFAKFSYSNKFYNYKLNFYECGFKNFSRKIIPLEINFILFILFILIYDGEFFILMPLALNISIISYEIVCITFFFFLWFLLVLFYDFAYQGLEWQV